MATAPLAYLNELSASDQQPEDFYIVRHDYEALFGARGWRLVEYGAIATDLCPLLGSAGACQRLRAARSAAPTRSMSARSRPQVQREAQRPARQQRGHRQVFGTQPVALAVVGVQVGPRRSAPRSPPRWRPAVRD